MADPGSGNIVANNVLMGSTTQLAFSKFDTAGTDRSSLFLASELNDQLLIQDQTNSANWIRYTITAVPTNNVTWFMVPVVTVTGSGTNPAQNDKLMVTFENTAGGSGYSGYSGIGLSGYSGYSGSGVSGYSGYSGPAGGGGTPGGSNTQVQYNNAGAFGGTSAVTTSGSILTTTLAPAANTVADGSVLTDTTAATSGNQQYSPALHFTGQGWKTTATAASQTVDFREYLVPVQGAANPTGNLTIDSQVNAGGYGNSVTFDTSGGVTLNGGTNAAALTAFRVAGTNQVTAGGVGFFYGSGAAITNNFGNHLNLANSFSVTWAAGSVPATPDTGISRNAAGVVEINNGTAGSLAFLKADRINANGSQPSNASTAAVSAGYASDTYLAGSSVTINTAGAWRAGGAYHLIFDMAKTAAGVATPILTVRMGTLGTTADASILVLTFPAGTAAIDTGIFEVWLNFRSVGSGTSAVIQGVAEVRHNQVTTGLVNTVTGSTEVIVGTSAGFASTTQTILGVSFNGGTAFSGTNTLCQAQLIMP
jgi:hypothetical protein